MRGIVPIVQYLVGQGKLNMSGNLTGNLFSVNILYFIGGYYFGALLKKEELTAKKMYGWLGAGLVTFVIACLMTQYKINITGLSDEYNAQTFYNNLISIPTFAMFYAVRYVFANHQPTKLLEKIITICGEAAFGIMLFEQILRTELSFVYTSLFPVLQSLPSCIIWISSVYLCGLMITLCLKKIPGIKILI